MCVYDYRKSDKSGKVLPLADEALFLVCDGSSSRLGRLPGWRSDCVWRRLNDVELAVVGRASSSDTLAPLPRAHRPPNEVSRMNMEGRAHRRWRAGALAALCQGSSACVLSSRVCSMKRKGRTWSDQIPPVAQCPAYCGYPRQDVITSCVAYEDTWRRGSSAWGDRLP